MNDNTTQSEAPLSAIKVYTNACRSRENRLEGRSEMLFSKIADLANLADKVVDDANFEDESAKQGELLAAAGCIIKQIGWMADKGTALTSKRERPILMRGGAVDWLLPLDFHTNESATEEGEDEQRRP